MKPPSTAPVDRRDRPPLRGPLGYALAGVYGSAVAWRNRRFDRGRGVVTFDRPVISVGNVSVGGTGKTPLVAHLTRLLLGAGHRPCIAMRGYGATRGRGLESDEALAYRRELSRVPMVAQPNRTEGLIDLFGTEPGRLVDCVILDDGFQHRQIARDLDIVVVDATRSLLADRLLPAGWLREPVSSIARADAVVVSHAEAAQALQVRELEAPLGGMVRLRLAAVAHHQWTGLRVTDDDGEREAPLEWLDGKRTYAACAIGNPGPFLHRAQQAASRGGLLGIMVLRDHAAFEPENPVRVKREVAASGAQVLLVTEKDWSKLMRDTDWPCPVARPRLELGFERGGPELEQAVLDCVANFDGGHE
jgi:tetraacyldisaccharide 4'-kinase